MPTLADTATTQRACPLCSADAATVRRVADGWPLATCDGCGFLYAPTIRANTATEHEDLPEDYEPVSRARHAQVHRLLSRLLPEGATVADVGAGFGELGLVAAEAGRFRYIGFEPSVSITEVARRRGVDLRPELFDRSSLDEPPDAIVLDNVIEHVADPIGLLREADAALTPGGHLVVIVPNRHDLRQVVPQWRRANHWIPPEHINYFTAASLRRALEGLGHQVRPFGFRALRTEDWRYGPRAVGEVLGIHPFGLNVVSRRSTPMAR
jgi:SAM-dependent methyltransferase